MTEHALCSCREADGRRGWQGPQGQRRMGDGAVSWEMGMTRVGAVPSEMMSQSQSRQVSEAGWQPVIDTYIHPANLYNTHLQNEQPHFKAAICARHIITIDITSSSSEDCGGVTSGVGSGGSSR